MADKLIINAKSKKITLPVIPLRGLVVFPYMILHFDVARKKSIAALEHAMADNSQVFLVAQKNIETEEPKISELYTFGVVATVKQLLKLPNGNIHVLVEGSKRGKLLGGFSDGKYIVGDVRAYLSDTKLKDESSNEVAALIRTAKDKFDSFAQLNSKIPKESAIAVLNINEPGELSDVIASNVLTTVEDKMEILTEINSFKRLIRLVEIMERELEIASLEFMISERVKSEIDKNQKEYYLREQLKVIQEELDGAEGIKAEVDNYKKTLETLNMPESSKVKIRKDLDRLVRMQGASADAAVLRNYIETVFSMPWNNVTKDKINLKNVQKVLDNDHFGLEKVKERIVEFLAVKQMTNSLKGNIICLVGPPGVGKTSVAKSIARAIGRNYVRMSLGGVKDEAEIRGHRKTYIGAMPGRVISAIKQAGSRNPLILLDEIDKISSSYNGDPASALLEVLDGEQNFAFRDHYLEIPFDLSDVFFMVTANSLDTISKPLLDRMEVIELSSYTMTEKTEICKKFLVPKQRKAHGLNVNQLKISVDAIREIINYYTRESGVRNLERAVASICRKSAKTILEDGVKSVSVTPLNIENYLGRRKFNFDYISDVDEIGVVNGLAWTSVGGDTLKVEVNIMPGTGKVQLTGKLGDVMKESATAAISYIRANSERFGISSDFYKDNDIHIHVPEGATPKDGPSAGITMATALFSALKNCPVKKDIAMTGEITIRGRVLEIGGLKEKSIAAYRSGVTEIIIPKANLSDLQDIPQEVKDNVKFTPVTHIDEVFNIALLKGEVDKSYKYCVGVDNNISRKDSVKQ